MKNFLVVVYHIFASVDGTLEGIIDASQKISHTMEEAQAFCMVNSCQLSHGQTYGARKIELTRAEYEECVAKEILV